MVNTTNFHFHCLTDQVGDKRCLLFLQPVDSDSDKAAHYEYFAWEHFQPAKGSHNTIPLQTNYLASVTTYPPSKFYKYTDPEGLDLGNAKKVVNTDDTDPHFSNETVSIAPNAVGIYNACTTPDRSLSVIWYVNSKDNKVVQTNNTNDTKALPNDKSTFELKQTLYVTMGTYDSEVTYNTQTVSRMFNFPFKNDDTDLYFEINYDHGLVIKQTTKAEYEKSFLRSRRFRGTPLIQSTEDDIVFSGHGAIELATEQTKVPEGVQLVVLAPPAASVSNDLCQAVESGNAISGLLLVSPKTKEKIPIKPFIYQPGQNCPNYILYPIDGGWLKPGTAHLEGVSEKTYLSDLWQRVRPLLKPGKTINVYWAACTALTGASNPVVIAS